jgi:tetratricopeptide (TPR) repeat protein
VLATQGKTAFWQGRYPEAAQLASRGMNHVSAHTSTAVLLACREASAWAQLGAHDRALAALRAAEEGLQHARSPGELGGVFACGPARYANYAAIIRLRLGDPQGARDHAERAIQSFALGETRHYGTEAQVLITIAAAHLTTGESEAAVATLEALLKIAPDQRLDTLVRRLAQIKPLIADSRQGKKGPIILVEELVHEFCTNSVATLASPRQLAGSPILFSS